MTLEELVSRLQEEGIALRSWKGKPYCYKCKNLTVGQLFDEEVIIESCAVMVHFPIDDITVRRSNDKIVGIFSGDSYICIRLDETKKTALIRRLIGDIKVACKGFGRRLRKEN